jgi:hypothetical protein
MRSFSGLGAAAEQRREARLQLGRALVQRHRRRIGRRCGVGCAVGSGRGGCSGRRCLGFRRRGRRRLGFRRHGGGGFGRRLGLRQGFGGFAVHGRGSRSRARLSTGGACRARPIAAAAHGPPAMAPSGDVGAAATPYRDGRRFNNCKEPSHVPFPPAPRGRRRGGPGQHRQPRQPGLRLGPDRLEPRGGPPGGRATARPALQQPRVHRVAARRPAARGRGRGHRGPLRLCRCRADAGRPAARRGAGPGPEPGLRVRAPAAAGRRGRSGSGHLHRGAADATIIMPLVSPSTA